MPAAAGLPVSAALTGGNDHVNGFQIVRIGLGEEQIVDVCEYPDSGKINILPAMNKVVVDVWKSGMLAGKFIRKKDPGSFNLLVGLIAASFSDKD